MTTFFYQNLPFKAIKYFGDKGCQHYLSMFNDEDFFVFVFVVHEKYKTHIMTAIEDNINQTNSKDDIDYFGTLPILKNVIAELTLNNEYTLVLTASIRSCYAQTYNIMYQLPQECLDDNLFGALSRHPHQVRDHEPLLYAIRDYDTYQWTHLVKNVYQQYGVELPPIYHDNDGSSMNGL